MTIIDEQSADILRFTMMYLTHIGHDTNISEDSFNIGKTFCTKLWNSVRYILGNIGSDFKYDSNFVKSKIDMWIYNKLNITISQVNTYLEKYDFGEAIRCVYTFVWDDFCNCYLGNSPFPIQFCILYFLVFYFLLFIFYF